MATFTYQNTATLIQIANDLVPVLTMDDPIFTIFPLRPREAWNLRWEIKDNFGGLMALRGIGGEPTPITKVGRNIYEAEPGAYGQYDSLDEKELTMRAKPFPGNLDMRVPVGDMISESQAQLLALQVNRMRQICWLLALTGTFSIPLPNGGIGHTATVTVPSDNASDWGDPDNGTPFADLLDLQPTYGLGTSTSFRQGATAWMNSKTSNYLLLNRNADDIARALIGGGNTMNTIDDINRYFLANSAPQIRIYDDGYVDDSGVFQQFIPDDKVLVVGQRPAGETPGEFQMTYNAISQNAQPYTEVLDYQSGPQRKIPPSIQVHAGFNGGPCLMRPSQLVVMDVS